MALEDPEVQKGLLGTLAGAFAVIGYFIRRQFRRIDDLEAKVTDLEKTSVDNTKFEQRLEQIDRKVTHIHNRIDRFLLNGSPGD